MSFTKDKGIENGNYKNDSFRMSFTNDERLEHVWHLTNGINNIIWLDTTEEPLDGEWLDEFKTYIEEDHIFQTLMDELFGPLLENICSVREIILHEYGRWEHEETDEYKTVKRYIEMESDFVFVAPMIKLANILSQHTKNLFLFTFDHVSKLVDGPEWLGVPHGRDLFYQFGAPLVGHKLYNYSEHDKAASRLMMTLWGNFVKHGKLTVDGVKHHPHYTSDTKAFNRLCLKDNNVTIKNFKNFKPRKMAFWNSFLPQLNCPEKQCQSSLAIILVPHVITVSISIIVSFFNL